MTTALTVYESYLPATIGGRVAELMADELEGLKFEFERIKIPSGGGLAFTMPDGHDPEVMTELRGVIVDHHRANALWLDPFAGGSQPPTCASIDGVTGNGYRGELPGGVEDAIGAHACTGCPWNEFGTAVNQQGAATRGKRCKNMHRVYLLPQGKMFPWLLTLPPTSIREFQNYLTKRLIAEGLSYSQVVTSVKLKRQAGNGVPDYSVAAFAIAGLLSEEEAARAASYRADVKRVTRLKTMEAADYADAA